MKYKVILFSLLMAHSGNAYLYGSTSKDIKTYITNRDSLHVNSSTVAKSIIKGEVINDISIPSVGNALQGLLPGLMVQQNSGEPGNDFSLSNVYVRGRSSYAQQQTALVIVDGFESSLDMVSANEIETVTVLKDAAALALYGGRAANGVILIETKKGRTAGSSVEIRLQTGIQTPTLLSPVLDGVDYANLYNQALVNDGLAPKYSQDQLNEIKMGTNPYLYPNVNWQKAVLKNTAPLTRGDMTFRGGNDVLRYYVTLGLLSNGGLYNGVDKKGKENANTSLTRFNFRTNIDINISKQLSAALYAGGNIGEHTTPGGSYDAYSLLALTRRIPSVAFPIYNPNETMGGNAVFTNPVGDLLKQGLNKENSRRLQIILQLKYDLNKLLPGLEASAAAGYYNTLIETSPKTRTYARYALSQTGVDANNMPVYAYTPFGVDSPLTAEEGFKTDATRFNLRGQLNYKQSFGMHDVKALLFALSDIYKEYGVRYDRKYINYGANVEYGYRKTYFATLSTSYMGSDNFYESKRFGLFPSLSLGWILSNESFLKQCNTVDFLKLRASYGMVGNDQTQGRHLFDAVYKSNGGYLFGVNSNNSSGFRALMLANKDATWEHKHIFNLGVDATLWKNFDITFDLFSERQSGILTQSYSSVPGIVGASFGSLVPYINIGEVKNHGFELNLSYHGNINKKVNYFVNGMLSYAKNEIVNMGEEAKAYPYLYRRGHAIDTPYTLIAQGLYGTNDFDNAGNLATGSAIPQFGQVRPGDIRYKDLNNDNVIDDKDITAAGYSTVPEWMYSLRFGFKWNNFDFEALAYGVANRTLTLAGTGIYSFQDNSSASTLAMDSWTESNPNASYPRLSSTIFSNNYRSSTYWQRSGAYLRLRHVQLGYTLTSPFLNKMKIKNMYLYVNATNLFTISKLNGLFDAEMNTMNNYPITKTVNVGLKVSL